jgi:hypothetical protein
MEKHLRLIKIRKFFSSDFRSIKSEIEKLGHFFFHLSENDLNKWKERKRFFFFEFKVNMIGLILLIQKKKKQKKTNKEINSSKNEIS